MNSVWFVITRLDYAVNSAHLAPRANFWRTVVISWSEIFCSLEMGARLLRRPKKVEIAGRLHLKRELGPSYGLGIRNRALVDIYT